MDISLTSQQIIDAIGPSKCKVLLYPDLAKIDTIDKVFYDDTTKRYKNLCVVLYIFKKVPGQTYGHWCLLSRYPDRIQFFDSYGNYPDNELNYVPTHIKKITNELKPHIVRLLLNQTKYLVEYSDYKFQSTSLKVSTCGRWVIAKALFYKVSLQEFEELFKNTPYLSSDEKVVLFTQSILGY